RHTRWPRDWSSDVCSSDLPGEISPAWIDPDAIDPDAAELAPNRPGGILRSIPERLRPGGHWCQGEEEGRRRCVDGTDADRWRKDVPDRHPSLRQTDDGCDARRRLPARNDLCLCKLPHEKRFGDRGGRVPNPANQWAEPVPAALSLLSKPVAC